MMKIPVSSLLPVFGLYYTALGAEKISFSDNYIEYGLSPNSLNFINKSVYD